jgi:hypothetical protein
MRKLLYVFFAASLTACTEQVAEVPTNRLVDNDFESMDGWLGDNTPPSLTKEKAHSGHYGVKVSPTIEYSMGYQNPLSKLSSSQLQKIRVRCWVNLSKGTTETLLVTSVTNPSAPQAKPILWEGTKVAEKVKSINKWEEISKVITLPANVANSSRLSVYLWSTGAKETVFMDDMTLEKVQ